MVVKTADSTYVAVETGKPRSLQLDELIDQKLSGLSDFRLLQVLTTSASPAPDFIYTYVCVFRGLE